LVAGSSGQGTVYTFGGNTVCTDGLGAPVVACVARKRLVIQGGLAAGSFSGYNPAANLTVIDGQGRAHGIGVFGFGDKGSAALDIKGFTVRNGLGAGISKRDGDGRIFGFGGGLLAENSDSVLLTDMIFDSNRAVGSDLPNGVYGGSGAGGGLSLNDVSTVNLSNVRFVNNQAIGGAGAERGGYGLGGGIFSFQSNISGNGVYFENNIARGGSGGSGVAPDGQRADGLGGGAAFSVGSNVNISALTAVNNQAIGGSSARDAGGGFGGAVFGENAIVTVTDSDLRNNLAQSGNAPAAWMGNGGGFSMIHSSLAVHRSKVIANTAQGLPLGGGISVGWVSGSQESKLLLTNSIVARNEAILGQGGRFGLGGGGLWIDGTDAQIEHSTIADNHIDGGMTGQGMRLHTSGNRGASVTIRYSLITGHNGRVASAVEVNRGSSVTFDQGLFFDNTWDTSADNPNAGNDLGTINGRDTMEEADPLYVSPGAPNNDYHIQSRSPARGQAVGSQQPVDVDNDPRTDGKPDLGADEYVGSNRPPLIYTRLGANLSSIQLAWTVDPDLESEVSRHQLIYRFKPPGGSEQQETVDLGDATSHTLRGVTPFVIYHIEVQALDANGGVVATGGATSVMPTDRKLFLPSMRK
jgi:hypothetical protein